MKTLIVGAGALGGTIAVRLRACGADVALAVRNVDSAELLKRSGLRLTGIGGAASIEPQDVRVAPLDHYSAGEFDLIVLAAKAKDAIDIAPATTRLLREGATLLPIQNGGVSPLLAKRLGDDVVLGGLSHIGATMVAPGVYEQRNAGYLLIGEIGAGRSRRAEIVRDSLRGIDARITTNFAGAIWSKLLLNCSVTTIGAVAGATMRDYITLPSGRELFDIVYDETLRVALEIGATPEPMIVDPIPPAGDARAGWVADIAQAYGGAKPSMLQDIERGRPTEIDFVNEYVVACGREAGVETPANAAIVAVIRAITHGELAPSPKLLDRLVRSIR
jgi:2-dehydropantoate 2-reductase